MERGRWRRCQGRAEGLPGEESAGVAGGEGLGGGEGGEIAVRFGGVVRGPPGADERLHGFGQGEGLGGAAAGERDGEEGGGGLGKGAAGAGEAELGDARIRRGRVGIKEELHGAQVATGRVFTAGDAVGRRQGAAVARVAAVVVDDSLEKFGGGIGHAAEGGRFTAKDTLGREEKAGAPAI